MNLDGHRARLWRDLGLGPVWTQRATEHPQAPGPATEPDGTVAAATGAVATLDWEGLEGRVAACTACALCKSRTQTVFGVGDRRARWMVIGEAPGAEEDARGEPFVGQAGRLLDRMLAAAGLSRGADGGSAAAAAVYIANVLKCRPPANRNPEPEEVARCEPYLRRQIELLSPQLILVMGRVAAQSLLGSDASIASLRGRAHPIEVAGRIVPVIVTYHPAYLLRNLADKAKVWTDLCLAREVFAQQAPSA